MAAVRAAIWDLDGTIVDTDSPCVDAARDVLQRYGKTLSSEAAGSVFGRRPLDVYTYLAETLNIPETPEALVEASQTVLEEKFSGGRLLPGVLRLLHYFKGHGIPMALATGTARDKIAMKLKGHESVLEFFEDQIGGDEVKQGKPNPEIFLLAASRLKVTPSECLVFEDSPAGAKAAKLAGMHVVLVPSQHINKDDMVDGASVEVLKSLMDFDPLSYQLPSFTDMVHGVIHMDPVISLSGTVVQGFGRGAKELGIRTANIDEESVSDELSAEVSGIYAGWASVGCDSAVYKMVMSIGWNPFYKNEKKTAEAWLLHEFPEDFYGEELRLLVVGYLRPECDFTTVEDLKSQIRRDARVAERYLDDPICASLRLDARLATRSANASHQ